MEHSVVDISVADSSSAVAESSWSEPKKGARVDLETAPEAINRTSFHAITGNWTALDRSDARRSTSAPDLSL